MWEDNDFVAITQGCFECLIDKLLDQDKTVIT